jgi:hypothetical protein
VAHVVLSILVRWSKAVTHTCTHDLTGPVECALLEQEQEVQRRLSWFSAMSVVTEGFLAEVSWSWFSGLAKVAPDRVGRAGRGWWSW